MITVKAGLVVAVMLLARIAGAGTIPLCDAAYKVGKAQIRAEYRAGQAVCKAMGPDAEVVCIETAKAREKVARAELKLGYCGTSGDRTRALQAKR